MSPDRLRWSQRALHALVWVGVAGALTKAALAYDEASKDPDETQTVELQPDTGG